MTKEDVKQIVKDIIEEIADSTDEARKEMLARALEVGIAAFRNRDLETRGLERT